MEETAQMPEPEGKGYSPKVQEILNSIKGLNVMELVELVDELREQFQIDEEAA